ncbi:MAG TPA: hypothetical protein VGK73_25465 [Polyangiaceae bacterium]
MSLRLVVATAASVSTLLLPRAVAAEVAGATIDVKRSTGAESCPDAQALEQRTLAHGRPRARDGEPLLVEVTFRPLEAGFEATVRTSGRSQGTRELAAAGPTCEPLAAATSVVLAVLLELLPHDEPVSPTARAERNPPRAPAASPSVFRYFAAGVRGGAAYGVLDHTFAAWLGADARVRLAHVEIELGGFVFPSRSIELAPGAVDQSLAGGSVGACGFLTRTFDTSELGACLSLSLGRLAASGTGYYKEGDSAALWIAGSLGARWLLPLGRHFALRFGLDVMVPFQKYEIEVERVGTVESAPLGGSVVLGPEWRIR